MSGEIQPATSLVIGGSGLVGGYIVEHLVKAGQQPLALSRASRSDASVVWCRGDLHHAGALKFPPFATLFCTADAVLLAWCAIIKKDRAYTVLNVFWVGVGVVCMVRAAGFASP